MSRYHGGWAPYVPVARRRASALREVEKLRKKGKDIQPVTIEGRAIARSFWGKAWCEHLESFGDYSNRLPRGRTYARNGSVCHLGIEKGAVEALVSGSALYRVSVAIKPLPKPAWNELKQGCLGRIGSIIELLQGKLSGEVMAIVTNRQNGLFPKPAEIHYECDCPDWAGMCKHIAAVMYGIGARLDARPELLFLLRGVDHEDLIASDAVAGAIAGSGSRRARRRALSGQDLASVFNIEFEESSAAPDPPGRNAGPKEIPRKNAVGKKGNSAKATKTAAGSAAPPGRKRPAPFKPTGQAVARLRKRHGMTRAALARAVGVSPATVANWEKTRGAISPHARGRAGLERLHRQSG